MEERSIGSRIFCVCNTIFMLLLIFVTAYPMYYVVIASFSDPGELSKQLGALWLPIPPFTLSAYEMVFFQPDDRARICQHPDRPDGGAGL